MFTISAGRGYRPVHLDDLPDTAPAPMGPRHRPIAHRALVNGLLEEVQAQLGTPGRLEIFQSPSGTQILGGIGLPGLLDTPDLPYEPGLFFLHGNCQEKSLILGAGGTVFVCTNGIISASHVVRRKHTTGLDLREYLRDAVTGARNLFADQQRRVEYLQHCPLSTLAGEAYLMRLAGRGQLPGTTAQKAWKDWIQPRHSEFKPNTKWAWYNAVTEAIKGTAPTRQAATLQSAFDLMRSAFDNTPRT